MLSVVMPVYNDERYVGEAVAALLAQSYADFELIIVNDHSTDRSSEVVDGFSDPRIVLVNNLAHVGIPGSRNIGISISKGEYIFSTDSDCLTDPDWLARGLEAFGDAEVVGVEGRTIYHEEGYLPTFSDKLPGDIGSDKQYMCCNVAYRRSVVEKLNGFDARFGYHEDRNFALRALELGEIVFCDCMVVTHRKKNWRITDYVRSAERGAYKVLLYKYNHDTSEMTWRIMLIRDLIKVLFPPMLIYTVINNEFRSWEDVRLIPFIWVKHLYARCLIWKQSIKERVLVL